MSEFSDSFFSILLDIQQDRPDLIDSNIYVINNYRFSRSESKGATTRSQDAKLPEDDINSMNGWNFQEEDVVNRPMCVVYSEHKQMLDTFLDFLLPL